MKNRIILAVALTAVVTVTAVLAGCSGEKNQIIATTTNSGTQTGGQPGNGGTAQQTAKPDLMGEVTSIKNGVVTLKLMEIKTQSGMSAQSGFQPQSGQMPNGPGGSAPASGQMPAGGSGTMPSMSAVSGAQGPGGGMGGGMQTEFTGKTKTITLTDSTKIVSMSPAQQTSSQTTLSLSSIKKGQTLYIYYKSGTTTIESVGVMDSSGNSGSGTGSK